MLPGVSAHAGDLDKLLDGVLSGVTGAPPQQEAPRRVWSEPQAAQSARPGLAQRYDALLVQTSNSALIVYPFGGKRFLDGKVAAQDWDSQDAVMTDWNRDGVADLLTVGHDGKLWLRLQLNGALQPAQAVDSARSGFRQVFSGDFDGDGNLEAIARQDNGDMIFYAARFAPSTSSGNGGGWSGQRIGNSWHFSHYWARDWNGDGTTDFLVRNEQGDLILYPLRNGAFQTGAQMGNGWHFTDYFADDWNGDRSPDLLVRNASGDLILYAFRAAGGFEPGNVVARGWRYTHYFPGEWAGQAGMLLRDRDGGMFFSAFQGQSGFLPPEQVGNDWHFQTYLPFRLK